MRVDAVLTQDIQCVFCIEGHIAVMFIATPPGVAYAPEDRDHAIETTGFGAREACDDRPVILHLGVYLINVEPFAVSSRHQINRQYSCWPQRARQLAQRLGDIAARVQVVEHVSCRHDGIGLGQRTINTCRQAGWQAHYSEGGSACVVASQLDHRRRGIDAMHRKTRRQQLAGEQAAAASNVENSGASRQAAVAQELHDTGAGSPDMVRVAGVVDPREVRSVIGVARHRYTLYAASRISKRPHGQRWNISCETMRWFSSLRRASSSRLLSIAALSQRLREARGADGTGCKTRKGQGRGKAACRQKIAEG